MIYRLVPPPPFEKFDASASDSVASRYRATVTISSDVYTKGEGSVADLRGVSPSSFGDFESINFVLYIYIPYADYVRKKTIIDTFIRLDLV